MNVVNKKNTDIVLNVLKINIKIYIVIMWSKDDIDYWNNCAIRYYIVFKLKFAR